jgi:hypothetical protein
MIHARQMRDRMATNWCAALDTTFEPTAGLDRRRRHGAGLRLGLHARPYALG